MPFVESVLVVRSTPHRPAGRRARPPRCTSTAASSSASSTTPATIRPARGASTCRDLVVSPGLVDTHVHINEPGRTEWEGFDTATRAAAAGGVTTLVDMPLNSVPATTSVAALHAKREAARAQCHVDVGFWGGVVPGNAGELDAARRRRRARVQVLSGAVRRRRVSARSTRTICARRCPILARRDVPLLVHAESWRIRSPADSLRQSAIRSRRAYTRPISPRVRPRLELDAIRLMIRLAEEFRTRVHIVHVSSAEGVAAIAARQGGLGADHRGDVPALPDVRRRRDPRRRHRVQVRAADSRGVASRRAVGAAWRAGRSISIATDHSPSPPRAQDARRFLRRAWGGIASLELSLPAIWTAHWRRRSAQRRSTRRRALESRACAALRRSRAMDERAPRRRWPGSAIGRGASPKAAMPIWSSGIRTASSVVESSRLHQRHKLTPYAGRSLFGDGAHDVRARRTRVGQRTGSRAPTAAGCYEAHRFVDLDRSRVRARSAARWSPPTTSSSRRRRSLITAARAGVARRRVHRTRQVDGRLGDAPPARDLGPDAHDWCIVRLRRAGIVRGVDVDTAFFTGNYPESCAIDACDLPGLPTPDELVRARVARVAAARRRSQATRTTSSPSTQRAGGDAPAAAHLSGRRRRAAARPRRGRRRLGSAAPSRRRRPGRRRARRRRRRVQRHVLRIARTT